MNATHTGIVPDTFKDGAEVVLKGTLSPSGFAVDSDGVMAKCPSKYEQRKGERSARAQPRPPNPRASTETRRPRHEIRATPGDPGPLILRLWVVELSV